MQKPRGKCGCVWTREEAEEPGREACSFSALAGSALSSSIHPSRGVEPLGGSALDGCCEGEGGELALCILGGASGAHGHPGQGPRGTGLHRPLWAEAPGLLREEGSPSRDPPQAELQGKQWRSVLLHTKGAPPCRRWRVHFPSPVLGVCMELAQGRGGANPSELGTQVQISSPPGDPPGRSLVLSRQFCALRP